MWSLHVSLYSVSQSGSCCRNYCSPSRFDKHVHLCILWLRSLQKLPRAVNWDTRLQYSTTSDAKCTHLLSYWRGKNLTNPPETRPMLFHCNPSFELQGLRFWSNWWLSFDGMILFSKVHFPVQLIFCIAAWRARSSCNHDLYHCQRWVFCTHLSPRG